MLRQFFLRRDGLPTLNRWVQDWDGAREAGLQDCRQHPDRLCSHPEVAAGPL